MEDIIDTISKKSNPINLFRELERVLLYERRRDNGYLTNVRERLISRLRGEMRNETREGSNGDMVKKVKHDIAEI